MAAKFEKFLISPAFPINFRKLTEFQRIIPKALKVMDKNLWGWESPGLNRVKVMLSFGNILSDKIIKYIQLFGLEEVLKKLLM